jgi:basic membrane lipoprotein Med (substrate-binding protein (PBP1-ABC) superfamily)
MTRSIRTRITAYTAVALAALAGSAVAATLGHPADTPKAKSAVVIAGAAANDGRLIERARSAGQDVRVVSMNADQLGVTLMLAARGYDEVVTVGVDRRTAIAPVQARYPQTRFVVADKDTFGR